MVAIAWLPVPPRPMALPATTPLLKHYIMIRWRCLDHGWFETGDLIFRHSADCPSCGMPAERVEHCEGMTATALPFVTRLKGNPFGDDEFSINPKTKNRKPAAEDAEDRE